jgi:hypothetical protein
VHQIELEDRSIRRTVVRAKSDSRRARFGVGGGTPDFTKGTTWCLDVLAALKDPNRNVPAKNHWTLIDTASEVRPYCPEIMNQQRANCAQMYSEVGPDHISPLRSAN